MNRPRQSDDTEESVVESIRECRPAPADCVLIALPALLIAGWIGGVLSSVSVAVAVAAGTLPALATLGYALFYDPPNEYTN